MSSSRANTKRSRTAARAPPANPNHAGMVFSGEIQMTKFDQFFTKKYQPTRFCDTDALDELGILEGVRTLFRNIGWAGILEIYNAYYERPTVEFLSSVYLAEGGMHFRLMNQNCHITYDEICHIIEAPTENTFGPDIDHLDGYNPATFWNRITRQQSYVPKECKSAMIIHPVLRIAHRILASVMFPRPETSTVSSPELLLLWCMTQNLAIKPNFGVYLARRLSSISPDTRGIICIGGLVTILAGAAPVNVVIPDTEPGVKMDFLNIPALQSMKILKIKPDGYHWTLHHSHFVLNEDTTHFLTLAVPTSHTDWALSEITGPADHEEAHMPDPPQQHQPQQGEYPPYHQTYLDRFDSLQGQFTDFRSEQNARWEAQQLHNQQMHYLMSDMHRALVLPREHQPPQAAHWPPYYPPEYPQYPPHPGPQGPH